MNFWTNFMWGTQSGPSHFSPREGFVTFQEEDDKKYCSLLIVQAPVVQTLDSAIHWINHYPLDNSIDFASVYPLDSDLSSVWTTGAKKKNTGLIVFFERLSLSAYWHYIVHKCTVKRSFFLQRNRMHFYFPLADVVLAS